MPGQDRAQGMEPLGADFDERDEAVKFMLRRAIQACRTKGEYVASAGTGPAIFRIRIDSLRRGLVVAPAMLLLDVWPQRDGPSTMEKTSDFER